MDSRTPDERRAARAEREQAKAAKTADLLRLRREGKTYQQIGDHFDMTRQAAHKAYIEALKAIPGMEIDQYRAEQLERLDDQLRRCYEVLGRRHVVVSQGRVVVDDAGLPLEDDDVVLRTLEQIRKIETDRRQLLGLNAVVKTELAQTITSYQVDLGDGDAAKAALT